MRRVAYTEEAFARRRSDQSPRHSDIEQNDLRYDQREIDDSIGIVQSETVMNWNPTTDRCRRISGNVIERRAPCAAPGTFSRILLPAMARDLVRLETMYRR